VADAGFTTLLYAQRERQETIDVCACAITGKSGLDPVGNDMALKPAKEELFPLHPVA
jgi:hypothetical protein